MTTIIKIEEINTILSTLEKLLKFLFLIIEIDLKNKNRGHKYIKIVGKK